jgi:hypothetical protein
MKKRQSSNLHVFLDYYWWWNLCRFTWQEWKNFIKVNMVLLKQKGGSVYQFVDKMVSVLFLAEFVATLPEVREQLTRIAKWFMEEGSSSYLCC